MAGIQLTQPAPGPGVVNAAGLQVATSATVITGIDCPLAFVGTPLSSYAWSFSAPTGSAAKLSSTSSANPVFQNLDLPGPYAIQLIGPDGTIYTLTLTVQRVARTNYTGPVAPATIPPSQVATPPVGGSLFCDSSANGAVSAKFPDSSIITFVGQFMPAMKQLSWFIDSVAGSNSNDGASAVTALADDAERQRRMGPLARWNQGDYHLRYLNDLDAVVIVGDVDSGSAIFVHGSAADGQGQATLFSGAIDALTVQHGTLANDPWLVTANALPTSWNASGLIGSFLASRCRLISGSAGAKFWAFKETSNKVARCSDTLQATTFALATYGNPDTFTYPALGLNNTFVAEKLTQIKSLTVGLRPVGLLGTFGDNSPTICFESLKVGRRDAISGRTRMVGRATVIFDGCEVWNATNNQADRVYMLGSQQGTTSAVIAMKNTVYHAGFNFGNMTHNVIAAGGPCLSIDNWIIQGGSFLLQQPAQINQLGIFDATASAIQLLEPSHNPLAFFQANGVSPKLWGSGNASFAIWFSAGTRMTYPTGQGSGLTIVGGGASDFAFPGANPTGKTSVRAFDDGVGTYTAARSLTFANLLAAVASGGFGGTIFDPATGALFAASGAPNSFS